MFWLNEMYSIWFSVIGLSYQTAQLRCSARSSRPHSRTTQARKLPDGDVMERYWVNGYKAGLRPKPWQGVIHDPREVPKARELADAYSVEMMKCASLFLFECQICSRSLDAHLGDFFFL
jgi:hypothetical protein